MKKDSSYFKVDIKENTKSVTLFKQKIFQSQKCKSAKSDRSQYLIKNHCANCI